ncbi:hypothetical protein HRE53_28495 (plasmid) [Acaryochloris sp. 'Moss Beach']|uniref:hypothetical protein n=1 Tax=Acaryochloris sp. 'Moss Beach' TaxID=2740837 RepID=UPI001F44817E|nr:hypothetical protein [Acaryochloris sp. 'Moss Beach']UJB72540.1 hypothetical protein HRE53_28495 [Acaryochloris sp. 'Moss Beach']
MFQPLTGIDLIDCARANAKEGLKTAAQLCGYGTDVMGFQHALTEAGQYIGMDIESLDSLLAHADYIIWDRKIEMELDMSNSL